MTQIKSLLLSLSINSIKQKGCRSYDDDYTTDNVKDGCAKAFVVAVALFFLLRYLWTYFI